jgi:hypothetical protein
MMYDFVIAEGEDSAVPAIPPQTTQPVWSTLLAGIHIPSCTLSEGVYNALVTQFVLTTVDRILNVVIPNNVAEPPRLVIMAEYKRHKQSTSVAGFEKAFIQNIDDSVLRLCFPWEAAGSGSVDTWTVGSCAHVTSTHYPTLCDETYPLIFDEGTGRIAQHTPSGFQVVDTALLYMTDESL